MKKSKYSKKFERDFNWYTSLIDVLTFDGAEDYFTKKGDKIIQEDLDYGVSAKEAFYKFDSEGVILKTNEPKLLKSILKTKGSVNLHIQMYAEDLYKGYLFTFNLNEIIEELKAPQWFEDAVRRQADKLERTLGEGNFTGVRQVHLDNYKER